MLRFKNHIKGHYIIWLAMFLCCVFLTLNKNSKSESGIGNYQSEFWSDKGGYYIYLPWCFIADFDASNLPENIEESMGNSFSIENGNLNSKYMMGVAVLQVPFFLIAHGCGSIMYDEPTGFEKVYAIWMGVGSVFYLMLGIYFTYLLICKFYSKVIGLVSIFIIFLGTNLFYYAIDETLMSHVYGFAIIAVLNWLIIGNTKKDKWGLIILLTAIVVLVRPTNIFYIALLLFCYRNNLGTLKINLTNLLYLFFGGLLVLIQLFYWYDCFGVFYPKGYESESFSNIFSPKLLLVLLSPNNGWLPYATVFASSLLLSLFVFKKLEDKRLWLLTWITFLCMIYLTASWWTYDFGCGMGVRNLVDFSSVWMVFTAMVIKAIGKRKSVLITLGACVIILCFLNMNLTYAYDNCFFGEANWDWNFYFQKLLP